MAWRVVKQPNGKYAIFSEVVDDFTVYDMTREEAVKECYEKFIRGLDREAEQKVSRADAEPQRFEQEIATIRAVHGRKESAERRRQLTGDSNA